MDSQTFDARLEVVLDEVRSKGDRVLRWPPGRCWRWVSPATGRRVLIQLHAKSRFRHGTAPLPSRAGVILGVWLFKFRVNNLS